MRIRCASMRIFRISNKNKLALAPVVILRCVLPQWDLRFPSYKCLKKDILTHTKGSPPLCVSSPGSSIPTWPWWLSDSAPLKNFDTKSDFWELRPIRHLISMMSRQKDKKRQKHKKATGKNTKIQKKWKIRKDKKATRRRDNMKKIQKIQLDQKDSLVLWRQGSFKLLRCFFLQWNPFGIGDPPPALLQTKRSKQISALDDKEISDCARSPPSKKMFMPPKYCHGLGRMKILGSFLEKTLGTPPPPQNPTKLPCARQGALTQNNQCSPERLALKVQ